jgi:hypothetical protein
LKLFRDTATNANIFVPAMFGRVGGTQSTRRAKVEWNWEKYRTELQWPETDIARAKGLVDRLIVASGDPESETRFHSGYVHVSAFGRQVFGVTRSEVRGLELFFSMQGEAPADLPSRVKQRRSTLNVYFSGDIEDITDTQFRQMCEAALEEAGHKSSE